MLKRICIAMKPGDVGGPSSFVRKLTAGLERRGVATTYSLDDPPYDAVLVINATRELGALWRCKRAGIPIVQRLGGLNWAHRFLPVGLRGSVLAEVRNVMMSLVRARFADAVIYQSHYSQDMWDQKHGTARVPTKIVYNGVDLERFSPVGTCYESSASICLISVEGTLGADPWLIPIRTSQQLIEQGRDAELLMFGQPRFGVEAELSRYPFVNFKGVVPNHDLPLFYRAADVYIFTDVMMGWCPNSVIEALACGTPVVGFRAGVLPEMLGSLDEWCAEYGGNPWRMECPQGTNELAAIILRLVETRAEASTAARQLAVERYDLDLMIDQYLGVLAEIQ
jgi:glycosyltransferase involved in cell wall biosynthesis